MYAHKTTITVPESRHVELDLPSDVPAGEAELIVLVAGAAARGLRPGSAEAIRAAEPGIVAWRTANAGKLLSAVQIDEYLAQERGSWDDR